MAEEIEIRNVGGRDGVASEATMQLLLTEFRAKAGSDSRYQKLAERATNLNTKAQDKNTKETNLATKAMKSAGSALKGLRKEAAFGGDRLGDFASAAFGASSKLTKIVRFGDDTIDTLRGLTSVGASFNNNMFDMIGASANSAMNLGDFASMVQNNSGIIATFGSTVTAGARNLGQFSKEFRTGIGQEFFAMGFTIGDVNEGLISFLDLERRRSLAGLRTDRASQQAAADYILQLDQLTKLTGEEREQVADRLRQQMQDAGVRAQVNRLEGTARTNFQNSLAFIESQLSGPLADGLKDLMDGVAQTDLGKALQSQVPGIGEFAQQMFRGGKSVDEVIDAMTNRFGPQLQSLSGQFSKAQLDQMRMSGGITGAIAEILDSSYQINQITGRDAEAAEAEQRRRERITSTLGGFEQAITSARKFVIDAFLDAANRTDGLASAFKTLFATVGKLFGDGDGSLASLGTTLTKNFNNWFGTGGSVTNLVNKFSNALATTDWEALFASIDNTFTSFTNWLSGIYETYKSEGFGAALTQAGNNILNSILDLFLGKKVDVDPRDIETDIQRQGGLIKSIYDGILGMLESTGATEFMTSVYDTIYSFLFEEDANGKTKMKTFLTTAYNNVTTWLFGSNKTGSGFLTNVKNKLNDYLFPETSDISFIDNVKNKLKDLLFGKEVDVDPRDMETNMQRQGGLIEAITTGFSELLGRQTIVDSITNGFTNILNSADTALRNVLGLPTEGTLFDSLKFRVLGDGTGPTLLDKFNDAIFGKVVERDKDFGNHIRRGGIVESISKGFSDLFNRPTVIANLSEAMKGMFESVSNGFVNFWEGPRATELKNTITDFFHRMVDELILAINDSTGLMGGAARNIISKRDIAENRGTGLAYSYMADQILQTTSDEIARWWRGETPADVAEVFGEEIGRLYGEIYQPGSDFSTTLAQLSAKSKGYDERTGEGSSGVEPTIAEQQFLRAAFAALPPIPRRDVGTLGATGQRSEPEGGLMNIHAGERVLSPEETRAYNQTGGDNKIDQLNNTMMQVVALLAQGNQISERTAKGLRGMTNDFYRGMT